MPAGGISFDLWTWGVGPDGRGIREMERGNYPVKFGVAVGGVKAYDRD